MESHSSETHRPGVERLLVQIRHVVVNTIVVVDIAVTVAAAGRVLSTTAATAAAVISIAVLAVLVQHHSGKHLATIF